MLITAQPNSLYQIQTSENNVDSTFSFGTTGTFSVPGNIEIKYLSSAFKGIITTDLITNSDKKWSFPNKSGRVALIDDIITGGLPDQTGNSGKFLQTDGTTLSWKLIDTTGGNNGNITNASFTAIIGDGFSRIIKVLHNLGTDAIVCSVWETLDARRSANCTISVLSENEISLTFRTAPKQNSIKVTIISSVFSNAISISGSGAALPSVFGNANKYLKTDGVSVTWQAIPEGLPKQENQTGKALFTNGAYSYWQLVFPVQNDQAGKVLHTDGTNTYWQSAFPAQTGQANKYLTTDGTYVSWGTPPYMLNPMSSYGDIIIGGTAGAAGRLGIGQEGQFLSVASGLPIWKDFIIPSLVGNNGKFLTTDGLLTNWQTINQVPTISTSDNGKILSTDGTNALWIVNTAPPAIAGQAGKFLGNTGSVMAWYSLNQVPTVNSGTAGKLLSSDGASYSWTSIVNVLPSLTDNTGKVLTVNGSTVDWEFPATGFTNPMTTIGDIIVGTTGGSPIRLGHGSTGQYLTTQSNGTLAWTTITPPDLSGLLTNPMTNQGDLIYGGTSGAPTRLGISGAGYYLASNGSSPYWVQGSLTPPVTGHAGKWLYTDGSSAYWANVDALPAQSGNSGKYLSTNGSLASWITPPPGFANPMIASGDMIAGSTNGIAGRLAIGTNGQFLGIVAGALTWTTTPTELPTQTGHQNQFLLTDGSAPSWTTIYQVPTVVDQTGKFLGNDGVNYSWMSLPNQLPVVNGQSGGKYLSNDGTIASWVPYSGIPNVSGNSGKVLTTDGVTSFWEDINGVNGSATLSRLPIQITTSNLDILSDEIRTVDTTCYTFQLQSITASHPCRIRLYGTNSQAVADRARLVTLDPVGNHGMYTEIVLSQSNLSWILSPVPTCVNMDTVLTKNIYVTIQNMNPTATAIVVTMNILKME